MSYNPNLSIFSFDRLMHIKIIWRTTCATQHIIIIACEKLADDDKRVNVSNVLERPISRSTRNYVLSDSRTETKTFYCCAISIKYNTYAGNIILSKRRKIYQVAIYVRYTRNAFFLSCVASMHLWEIIIDIIYSTIDLSKYIKCVSVLLFLIFLYHFCYYYITIQQPPILDV